MDPRPDPRSRSRDGLAAIFEFFAEVECPQVDAHLYGALCRGIAGDRELLDLVACAPATQPPPNLIFGGVHYLLLAGEEHPLRRWYPALAAGRVEDPATAFPAFADIVAREGRPLAMIEIGPSAGLNLQWSRYRYAYRRAGVGVETTWGDPEARVLVECEQTGAQLPTLPEELPVASRQGIDINPIDLDDGDAVQWLRALVWPDHVGRQERLSAAIDVAREDPPELIQADASLALPDVLGSVSSDAVACVFGTHTLYPFPPDALRATLKAMQAAGRERATWFVSLEGTGDRCSELRRTEYRNGDRVTALLARANPHGRWLDWLGPAQRG